MKKIFEKGKRYVFKKELYLKWFDEFHDGEAVTTWVNECDNKEVEVKTILTGRVGKYGVNPIWCEEIK